MFGCVEGTQSFWGNTTVQVVPVGKCTEQRDELTLTAALTPG